MYNIEVEGDHCYRVGQQGLLVHNASGPDQATQTAIGDSMTKFGCCLATTGGPNPKTINLATSGWDTTALNANGIVYTVRDKDTGLLLKIGETEGPSLRRFEDYVRAMRQCKKQKVYGDIVVDMFMFDRAVCNNTKPSTIEADARKTVCPDGSPTLCPWDNSNDRLGRPGPGTPYDNRTKVPGAWTSCTMFTVSAGYVPLPKGRPEIDVPTKDQFLAALRKVGTAQRKLAMEFNVGLGTMNKWTKTTDYIAALAEYQASK